MAETGEKTMTNFDDIERDMREQQATKRYQEWLGSEEYRNSVQLKYEALLCDPELINEAIGADGIQYPFGRHGLLEDVRKRELEYENDTYYPYIAAAVMHKDATALGALILDQITNYVMGMAIEKIQDGYDGA
jgi:hypothetical protein